MATAKTRKPTGKEVLQYLNKQSKGAYDYPYMMNGFCEGKWYLEGVVVIKGDWIAIRLLYLMLALDPSNIHVAEVRNTYGYYENKFGEDGVRSLFALLKDDAKSLKSFDKNPDSKAVRELHKTLQADGGDFEDITTTVQSSVVRGAR